MCENLYLAFGDVSFVTAEVPAVVPQLAVARSRPSKVASIPSALSVRYS